MATWLNIINDTGYAFFVEYARKSPHRGILRSFLRAKAPSLVQRTLRAQEVQAVIDPNRDRQGTRPTVGL